MIPPSAVMIAAVLWGPDAVDQAASAGAQNDHLVSIRAHSLRSNAGKVRGLVFTSAEGFPGKPAKATHRVQATIASGVAKMTVRLPPGTYAIALIHDENGNEELDTNIIGMPREGVGASRNPAPRWGPPKFKDAKFELGSDRKFEIRINYL